MSAFTERALLLFLAFYVIIANYGDARNILFGEEVEAAPPPAVTYRYAKCTSVEVFLKELRRSEAVWLSGGGILGGDVSVWSFPDDSFGIFVYVEQDNILCSISTGWFVSRRGDAA